MAGTSLPLADVAIAGLIGEQTALVTGAARGIGRAVAIGLARAGANVCVSDIDVAGAERVAGEIQSLGRRAIAAAGDVGADSGRRAMVAATKEALGPIDILINNAGVMQVKGIYDITEADWDRMLNINAKAVFFLSQLVLPGMVARKKGSIVSLASAAGKAASGVKYAHYNVSKAAVIAMTKTLSAEVAKDGVRVNCVCPGIIDTDMWIQIDREQGQQMYGLAEHEWMNQRLAQVPLGRAGTVEDVAKVIVFLASPLAAYMTGQSVN
ncbi:MAG TPA: SDR family NAD(P)-dependent oxidoreductase, partial [Chloroflexota bacterium]|nr:SDR family NAD(P)-dependent oxidoreductase [Chloroflexota bacterium]